MPLFVNKKERIIKQNRAMLLIEPSIEEEQEVTSSGPLKPGQSVFGKHTKSDTAFQHDFINENQTNVISNSTLSSSSSSWHNSDKLKDTDKGRRSLDRHKTKLTSLLIILFGLFLHLNMKLVHSQTASPTLQLERENITAAKSLVFNPTAPSLNFSTGLTTTKLPSEINESNKTNMKKNLSLTILSDTSTLNDDQASVMTTTLEPSSINKADHVETNNSLSDMTTTPTTPVESLMVGEEEEEREGEFDTENRGGSNKFNTLMLEAARELADKLVDRIRSPSSSGEDNAPNESELANVDQPKVSDESGEDIKRREDKSSSTGEISLKREVIGESLDNKADTTSSPSSNDTDLEKDSDLKNPFKTYDKWRAISDDIIELFSKKVLPVIIENGYDVDAVTVTGMLQVFNGIRAFKPWALKLLDSWAKISPGILVGTQSDFGDFDECLNVRIDDPSGLSGAGGISDDIFDSIDEETGLKRSTVVGKYCLADVEFPKPPRVKLATRNEELRTDFAPIELRRPLLNFSQSSAYKDTIFVETGNFFHMLYVDPLRVGICLTNKIDPDSFEKVFNKLLDESKVRIHFRGRCVTKYDRTVWTTYQKVSAYVIVVACCLVILSTILDLAHTKLNKIPTPKKLDKWKVRTQEAAFKFRPLFTSFSVIRNTRRLFKPQARNTSGSRSGNENKANRKNHLPTTDSSAPSSEYSPSIERRSSTRGSAINLISAPPSLSISTHGQSNGNSCYNDSVSNSNSNSSNIKINPLSDVQFNSTSTGASKSQPVDCNLLCLHGIRVITMTWMIVNHTYLFGGFFVLWAHRRLIDIAEWPKSLSFQLVLNGWLTVETYFFLSAAIIVLNVLPLMKSRKFSYLPYIFHRLVRLMPAYIGLVCLNFLWPLISSGPVWLVKGKSFIQTPCENYLWTNFLFVNNWIWPEKQVSNKIIK